MPSSSPSSHVYGTQQFAAAGGMGSPYTSGVQLPLKSDTESPPQPSDSPNSAVTAAAQAAANAAIMHRYGGHQQMGNDAHSLNQMMSVYLQPHQQQQAEQARLASHYAQLQQHHLEQGSLPLAHMQM